MKNCYWIAGISLMLQDTVGHFRLEKKDDPGSHSDGSEVPGFKIFVQNHLV